MNISPVRTRAGHRMLSRLGKMRLLGRVLVAAVLSNLCAVGLHAQSNACGSTAAPVAPAAANAPKAFWVSQPVGPDETAMVTAGNIGSTTTVQLAQAPDCGGSGPLDTALNALSWTDQPTLQATAADVKFVIPSSWNKGVYAYRLSSAGRNSDIYYINKPDPWFIQGDQGDTASPGGWFQVHGTALTLDAAAPALALVSGTTVVAKLAADPGDAMNNGYRQRFSVPAGTPEGSYDVYVHNGHGGVQGWTKFANVLTSEGKPVPQVTVKRPAVWPGLTVDVTTQSGASWDEKFAAAIAAVKANGGGIISVPPGSYALSAALALPNKTLLVGAGKDATVLSWAATPRDGSGTALPLVAGQTVTNSPARIDASFSISDLSLESGEDAGICVSRQFTAVPSYLRRIACHFPNLATATPTGAGRPTSGIGVNLNTNNSNFEVSDSDFDVRTGFYLRSQGSVAGANLAAGAANAYIRFENNTVRWRDDEANQRYYSHNVIYEGNHLTYAGTLTGNGYLSSNNPNPGFWFAAYSANARDLYYGGNVTDHEDPTPLNAAIGLTFDGGGGAYFGSVASASGVTVQLAGHTVANSNGDAIRRGAFVGIVSGTGAGQWRILASDADSASQITVDHPWDIAPDTTSTLTIWRTLGRALFVNNDFSGKALLQTYFGTHDVVFAHNQIGTSGATVHVPIWVGGLALGGLTPGWHYQVLDNTVTNLGAAFSTVSDAFNPPTAAPAGTPVTSTHIYRNNRSADNQLALFDIAPGSFGGTGRPNAGFVVEKNQGLRTVVASATAPYIGVIRDNQSVTGNVPGSLSDFAGLLGFNGNANVLVTPAPGQWMACGVSGASCSFDGTRLVRFGVNGIYSMAPFQDTVVCGSTAFFGIDPLPGVGPKTCDYGLDNVSGLSALSTSAGAVSLVPGTLNYQLTVGNGVTSITVVPSAVNASIAVGTTTSNLTSVVSGTASRAQTLQVGGNTILIKVLPQGGVAQTYQLTVVRQNANANLAGLTLSGVALSPAFSSGITSYTAVLPNGTSSVSVTPTRSNASATIQVGLNDSNYANVTSGTASRPLALSIGSGNAIDVKVFAQDGTTQTYTVTVTRRSNVATLSGLSLSVGSLSQSFAPDTLSYTATVPNSASSVTVTPTPTDTSASMQLQFNSGAFVPIGAGVVSQPLTLTVGTASTIRIKVTAQDGTTKTYAAGVLRPSTDASLAGLSLSGATLSPVFAKNQPSYSASVAATAATATLVARATESHATLSWQLGTESSAHTIASGAAASVPLQVGNNTITVRATAQDGSTSTSYVLNVLRPSADATLSALNLSGVTPSINFAPGTPNYSGTATGAVSLMPVPTESHATLKMKLNGGTLSAFDTSSPQSLTLQTGSNTITLQVTAQDTHTIKNYVLTVLKPSTDASLSALSLSGATLSPVFAKNQPSYSASVAATAATATLVARPTESHATLSWQLGTESSAHTIASGATASVPLQVGNNTITVRATAQDGSTSTSYVLNVLRPSADATLSALNLSGVTPSINFAPGTPNYSGTATGSVSLMPVPTESHATLKMKLNNGTLSAFDPSVAQSMTLQTGSNTITLQVTAQDTHTVKTYVLTVLKPSTDASLSALSLSGATLSFNANTPSYSTSVAGTAATATLVARATESHATLSWQLGTESSAHTISSGGAASVPLATGTNTITVQVTAQDGSTTKSYVLTVMKPSIDANLKTLALSGATLSANFAPGTIGYSGTTTATQLTLVPQLDDANATLKLKFNSGILAAINSGDTQTLTPQAGTNTITMQVTAQDTHTIKTYLLTIARH